MLLLPLLLASLVVDQGAAAGRQRRMREVQSRLGQFEAPPSGLRRRMEWTLETYRLGIDERIALRFVVAAYANLGGDGLPSALHRDPPLEALLPWLGREMVRGIPIEALDWEQAFQLWNLPVHELRLDTLPSGSNVQYVLHQRLREASILEVLYLAVDEGLVVAPATLTPLRHHPHVDIWRLEPTDASSHGSSFGLYLVAQIHPAEVLRNTVRTLRDWVEGAHPNLSPLSFGEAVVLAKAWHIEDAARNRKRGPLAFRDPVPNDPNTITRQRYDDGAVLVELRSRKALEAEGESMGHCVGSHARAVAERRVRVFSYRAPDGVPWVTWELDTSTNQLRDLEGPRNTAVGTWFLASPTEEPVLWATARLARDRVMGFLLRTKGPAWTNAARYARLPLYLPRKNIEQIRSSFHFGASDLWRTLEGAIDVAVANEDPALYLDVRAEVIFAFRAWAELFRWAAGGPEAMVRTENQPQLPYATYTASFAWTDGVGQGRQTWGFSLQLTLNLAPGSVRNHFWTVFAPGRRKETAERLEWALFPTEGDPVLAAMEDVLPPG